MAAATKGNSMDYDIVFVDDERNAVRVNDHRANRPSTGDTAGMKAHVARWQLSQSA